MTTDVPLGLDLYRPIPEDNLQTAAKVALGRRLFSEPLLSRDGTRMCASCHDPSRAFTDGRPVAVGVRGQRGTRSAPTLVNRVYGQSQFWDGRARSLEDQAIDPITNPRELDLTLDEAVDRLARSQTYRDRFRAVFGRPVNREDLARALASYVRSILSGDSPFDRYVNGDTSALSEQQRRGLALFRGRANCTACHVGPLLSDERFHNTGIAWRPYAGSAEPALLDLGRFAVTGKDADRGAFKTPTLREVARTAPYMHDGSLATLEAVVDHYDRGGTRNPHFTTELRPLGLTPDEKRALIAFLESLSGTIFEGHPLRPGFLREDELEVDPLFELLERDAVRLDFDLSAHWPRVRTLMNRYERMDLTDASIVVMSELHARSQVLTIDRTDFSVYPRHDRQTIDFVAPPSRAR